MLPRFLVAFLLLTSSAFAQLQVGVTSGYRIEGLSDVKQLPDGSFVSATAPKGVVPQGSITISGVKSALVRAYDATTYKPTGLQKTGQFSYSWTSPKTIYVEITYVDSDGNLASDDKTVSLPDDPEPTPTPVPVANDPAFVAATSAVVNKFVVTMANDWDATANGIRQGKYKNLVEAANDNKLRDDKTRMAFKNELSVLMKPKLGDGPLVKDADKVFDDLSTAFRSAVK